jgi:hypothetical protein
MVAGLISRIVIVPGGMLAQTALLDRLVACAIALAAYHVSRRNLFVGVAAGVAVIMALAFLRGT